MAHRERFHVEFAHVDMMGHVNNAQYFTYFETARTNYVLALKGMKAPIEPHRLDIIVAKASCEYKRGLQWGETIEVIVWPRHVGRTSFTFAYALLDGAGKVAARGETVQVAFDYQGNRKKAIPDDLRVGLERDLAAGPGVQGIES